MSRCGEFERAGDFGVTDVSGSRGACQARPSGDGLRDWSRCRSREAERDLDRDIELRTPAGAD